MASALLEPSRDAGFEDSNPRVSLTAGATLATAIVMRFVVPVPLLVGALGLGVGAVAVDQ